MSILLNGTDLNRELAESLKEKISSNNIQPQMVIIQVGDREESNIYVKRKIAFADKIGAKVLHKKYPENIDQKTLQTEIAEFNSDALIHGIIVQLPLPKNIDKNLIIDSISPSKDVDGMTAFNSRQLIENKPGFIPATTEGILTLLDHYKIEIAGKHAVVVGRSSLVGKPTALALLNRDATVTVCHSATKDIKAEIQRADIIVVAAGKAEFITKDFVSPNQVIIDVGINVKNDSPSELQITKRKIVGDVDFEHVKDIVHAITPVPGGVGPMTIFSLFENLVKAAQTN